MIFELIGDARFKRIMSDLAERRLFFTQGVGFGLKKNLSKGFTWHIESQSFGFNRSEDYGTTLWAPLHRIDTRKQGGGMRYVPRDVISGEFMYDYIDPAVFRCLGERIQSGGIAFEDYVALRDEPLNSSGIGRLLEYFSAQDDFELGDVLLFDKYVIHRSVPLGEGELESRDAFSLRFIADDSRYDLECARSKVIDLGVTRAQKAELIAGVTRLLQEVLGKDPASTFVLIDEVNTDNWGTGGEQVSERRKRLGH